MHDTKKKLATAVQASGTSLTGIFGVGPIIAATVIGAVREISRFPDRDHLAACNAKASPTRKPEPLDTKRHSFGVIAAADAMISSGTQNRVIRMLGLGSRCPATSSRGDHRQLRAPGSSVAATAARTRRERH
jgi:hypothetical protein